MQFKKIQYLLIDFYNNIRVLMFSDYNFQYNSILLLAIIGFVIFIINHQIVLYLYQKK